MPPAWRAWREQVKPGVFSQWAFSKEKHHTLKRWQELEEATVVKGGVGEDLKQILLSIKAILLSFFNR